MRKRSVAALAGVTAAAFLLAACGSSSSGGSGASSSGGAAPFVGVILPDTASSARWENNDRPYLTEAFKAAGVKADIQNAQGDKAKFETIADAMLNEGVNVLMIVNLDSASVRPSRRRPPRRASRPSTTTASRWAAARRTTSRSTTWRSARPRAPGSSSACRPTARRRATSSS